MKRILFAVFGVIIMLPMASVAVDCTMVDGQCPAGCYMDSNVGCTQCPAGYYNPTQNATTCQECQSPEGADFAEGDEYKGMTTNACPWYKTCYSGEYVASTTNLTCQPCGDYYTAKGGEFTITGSGSAATDIDSYKKSNRCDGKVYKLELKPNSAPSGTTTPHIGYFKYNGLGENQPGFSTAETGPWNKTLPAELFFESGPVRTFSGFYDKRPGIHDDAWAYFSSQGFFSTNSQHTQNTMADLNKDNIITLYAGWTDELYHITYIFNNPDYNRTEDCGGEDNKQCTVSDHNGKESASNGTVFNNTYRCYKDTKLTQQCETPIYTVGTKIGEPTSKDEKTRYFVAQYDACPAGHYCTNGKTYNCPAGTTSDPGAGSATNCYMVRGDGGTKFCDNTGDCFYLPGSGHVPHANAASN